MNREFFCEKCGKSTLGLNIKFCPYCGERFSVSGDILTKFCTELLGGNDPRSSKIFQEISKDFSPEVVQIIQMSLKQINREKQLKESKQDRRGQRWSKEEEDQLKQEYSNKLSINQICKIHKRSHNAVMLRIIGLFPELAQVKEKNINNSAITIFVGSRVTYLQHNTGEAHTIKIVAPQFIDKPIGGTGAYYELESRREVIAPDISKHEISSESTFAKQILGLEVGSEVEIYPNSGESYVIKILKIEQS